jgi:hypothetical protein
MATQKGALSGGGANGESEFPVVVTRSELAEVLLAVAHHADRQYHDTPPTDLLREIATRLKGLPERRSST